MSAVPGGKLRVFERDAEGLQSWRDATAEEAAYYHNRMAVWDGYEDPGPPKTDKLGDHGGTPDHQAA
jgi:hypothetical protein